MLSLWNPLVPERSKSDSRLSPKDYFDRLFENTFNTMARDLFTMNPLTNLGYHKNEDGTLSVALDVPGIKEEDLNIEVKDGTVRIYGETKTERSYRKISQAFSVPEGYHTDEVKAELANGVLTITLPAKQKPQPEVKKIAISSKK